MRNVLLLPLLLWPTLIMAADESGVEFFERKIRPVLVEHCSECHSATAKSVKAGLLLDSRGDWMRGGDSGAAIVPGKPEESLLIAALKYDGLEMPPKTKLPDSVIADFERWVQMGAPDPRKESDKPQRATRSGIDIEAGRKFWCYQPIQRPQLPPVRDSKWGIQELDRFILAKLDAAGLKPVGDADRATWLRRVTFDLTGLPPSPDEIHAFEQDQSPQAFEVVVDRLLNSPRYGERWGRHWLDVARYAESSGGGRSMMFAEAWRYRDYVIRAFNQDRPFDQFVTEQLAGDLLPAETPEQRADQLVATALLVLGPTNYEEQNKSALEMDVIDEQIDTLGKTLMGMTIGCARCHDHKFDPIPQRDYYALAGIFKSTHLLIHENVSKWLEQPLPMAPDLEAKVLKHEAEVAALKALIAAAKESSKKLPPVVMPSVGPVAVKDVPGLVIDETDAKRVGNWTHSTHVKTYVGDGYLHDQGAEKGTCTITFNPEFTRSGTYEVRLAYASGAGRAKYAPVQVLHLDGEFEGTVDQSVPPPVDGRFVSIGRFRFDATNQWFVRISNAGTSGVVTVDAVQFLPVDSAPQPLASAAPRRPDAPPLPESPRDVEELEKKLKDLQARAPYRPKAMSVRDGDQIENCEIRIRGNVQNRGPRVPRGFVQVASIGSVPEIAPDHSGRLELARWLTSPQHPLTARVLANRIWHHLFGVGIVRTVDNFGTTGELPSHPELLDWLAAELHDSGWSQKKLIRRIVLSRTYRLSTDEPAASATDQSSKSAASAVDPENRLLWRQNRKRLEAECLRDAMLTVSGQLDLTAGGLTIRGMSQMGDAASAEYAYQFLDSRRSVYTPVFRNRLLEIFEAFDFADPNLPIGRRNVTTVPTQALYLMNNPFVIEQSRLAAQRTLSGSQTTDADRLDQAFLTSLGRLPGNGERDVLLKSLRDHDTGLTPEERQRHWERIYQAIFSSVDFRYER